MTNDKGARIGQMTTIPFEPMKFKLIQTELWDVHASRGYAVT